MYPLVRAIFVLTSLLVTLTHGERVLFVIEEPTSSSVAERIYGKLTTRQLFGDDIPTDRPLSGNYYANYEGFPSQSARNKGKKLVYPPTIHNKATFTNDHNFIYTGADAGRIFEYPTSFIPYVRPTPKSLEQLFPQTKKPGSLQFLEKERYVEIPEDIKMQLDFVSHPIYSRSEQVAEESTPLGNFMRGIVSRISHLRQVRKSQGNQNSGGQRRNGQNNGINSKVPSNRRPIGYKLLAPLEKEQNQPSKSLKEERS